MTGPWSIPRISSLGVAAARAGCARELGHSTPPGSPRPVHWRCTSRRGEHAGEGADELRIASGMFGQPQFPFKGRLTSSSQEEIRNNSNKEQAAAHCEEDFGS